MMGYNQSNRRPRRSSAVLRKGLGGTVPSIPPQNRTPATCASISKAATGSVQSTVQKPRSRRRTGAENFGDGPQDRSHRLGSPKGPPRDAIAARSASKLIGRGTGDIVEAVRCGVLRAWIRGKTMLVSLADLTTVFRPKRPKRKEPNS